MGHFSNGTEGERYQEEYCYSCAHWTDEHGCPIWDLHLMHVGDKGWVRVLDKLIPPEGVFNGECVGYRKSDTPKEPPLRPGQVAGLQEWKGVAKL